MAYQISEDAKRRTTHCGDNFECLANDKCDSCRIDKEISGGLFIKHVCNKQFCKYFLYFGSHNDSVNYFV
jgi:hypothetical protein